MCFTSLAPMLSARQGWQASASKHVAGDVGVLMGSRRHGIWEGQLAGVRTVVCSTCAARSAPPSDVVSLGSKFWRGMFSCTLHACPLMVMLSGA